VSADERERFHQLGQQAHQRACEAGERAGKLAARRPELDEQIRGGHGSTSDRADFAREKP
jgi:hypothetical protein